MLITLGAGRYIETDEITSFYNLDTLVPKKNNPFIERLKEECRVIDITTGRNSKPRAVIFTKQGTAILTRYTAETIMTRIKTASDGISNEDEYNNEE